VATSGAVALAVPTQGKELVLTPDKTAAVSARYDFGWVDTGLTAKYTGKRWIDDMNTAALPDSTMLDFDVRVPISWMGAQNTYLQFNVTNLTNTREPLRVSTVSNAAAVALTPTFTLPGKTYYYYYNSPRTVSVTLHAQF
jgi:iron complex outermembrane receptor protein